MSLSVRSKFFPLLTTIKSLVIPKRPVSCKNFFGCRFNDDKNVIPGEIKALVKTEKSGVNIVDVKSFINDKFSNSQEYLPPVGGGFSKKSRRLDDDPKVPMAQSLLSFIEPNDRENYSFHTMTNQLSKCTGDCASKVSKDAGRVKYHPEMEDAINKQIMSELNAAFGYLSIASFFGRSDVGRTGTHNFFMVMCNEEIGHAMKLINYQLSRGGVVKMCNISVNESVEWCSIAKALEIALELEKVITHEIFNVLCLAKKHDDYHLENMLISEFVTEQYESINNLARMLARAITIGKCGVADHLIDKEMVMASGHAKPK